MAYLKVGYLIVAVAAIATAMPPESPAAAALQSSDLQPEETQAFSQFRPREAFRNPDSTDFHNDASFSEARDSNLQVQRDRPAIEQRQRFSSQSEQSTDTANIDVQQPELRPGANADQRNYRGQALENQQAGAQNANVRQNRFDGPTQDPKPELSQRQQYRQRQENLEQSLGQRQEQAQQSQESETFSSDSLQTRRAQNEHSEPSLSGSRVQDNQEFQRSNVENRNTHEYENNFNDPEDPHSGNYQYSYDIRSEDTGDMKFHKESRDGNTVIGEYRVKEADGSMRIVKYTADALNGFQATVEYVMEDQEPAEFGAKMAPKASKPKSQRNFGNRRVFEPARDRTRQQSRQRTEKNDMALFINAKNRHTVIPEPQLIGNDRGFQNAQNGRPDNQEAQQLFTEFSRNFQNSQRQEDNERQFSQANSRNQAQDSSSFQQQADPRPQQQDIRQFQHQNQNTQRYQERNQYNNQNRNRFQNQEINEENYNFENQERNQFQGASRNRLQSEIRNQFQPEIREQFINQNRFQGQSQDQTQFSLEERDQPLIQQRQRERDQPLIQQRQRERAQPLPQQRQRERIQPLPQQGQREREQPLIQQRRQFQNQDRRQFQINERNENTVQRQTQRRDRFQTQVQNRLNQERQRPAFSNQERKNAPSQLQDNLFQNQEQYFQNNERTNLQNQFEQQRNQFELQNNAQFQQNFEEQRDNQAYGQRRVQNVNRHLTKQAQDTDLQNFSDNQFSAQRPDQLTGQQQIAFQGKNREHFRDHSTATRQQQVAFQTQNREENFRDQSLTARQQQFENQGHRQFEDQNRFQYQEQRNDFEDQRFAFDSQNEQFRGDGVYHKMNDRRFQSQRYGENQPEHQGTTNFNQEENFQREVLGQEPRFSQRNEQANHNTAQISAKTPQVKNFNRNEQFHNAQLNEERRSPLFPVSQANTFQEQRQTAEPAGRLQQSNFKTEQNVRHFQPQQFQNDKLSQNIQGSIQDQRFGIQQNHETLQNQDTFKQSQSGNRISHQSQVRRQRSDSAAEAHSKEASASAITKETQ